MRNLSLTSPSTMSNSNALLSSTPSLVLRAPRSRAKATKVSSPLSGTPAQDVAKVNRSRALALEALKSGKSWGYYSNSEYSALKTRLNSAADLATIGSAWDEIIEKNLLGSKKACLASELRCLKIEMESRGRMRELRRVPQYMRNRKFYIARALVMEKDAVKFGIAGIKQFKENLKLCLTPLGQIHCAKVDIDAVLKISDDLKYRLRAAGHPAYQKGKTRRKHIRNCIYNRYFATPIIP